MHNRSLFPALAFLILAAIIFTTQPSSAVTPDNRSSASGQGEFAFFNGSSTEQWSYTFDVSANKHGQARGRAIFDITGNSTQTQVVVRVNCLNVFGSTGLAEALMTGTVLHSDDPDFAKGDNVIFTAVDNSGFPTPLADLITPIFVFEGDCHEGASPLTLFQQSTDAIHVER